MSLWHLISSLTSDARGFPGYAVVTLARCTASAAIGGLVAEWCLAPVVGPIAPFLVGSSVAWCASALRAWQGDGLKARRAAAQFPDLFDHHLRHRHPAMFAGADTIGGGGGDGGDGPLAGDGDGVYRSGWAILAMQYAQPTLASLALNQEALIKAGHTKRQERAMKTLRKKKTSGEIPSPPSATRSVGGSAGDD